MRRFALLGLLLSLTGCAGFGQFFADTQTFQSNPNMPPGDSENMRRVTGADGTQQALTPEPGNIWPPPAGPMPTLMDLEKQTGNQTGTGNTQGAPTQIQPTPGSSSPPQAGLGAEPPAPMPRASTIPTIRPAAGPPPSYQTPAGTAVPTASGPGYTTTTTPGSAGQSIVVPNGNGTSTIIHSDGTVETVPTPK